MNSDTNITTEEETGLVLVADSSTSSDTIRIRNHNPCQNVRSSCAEYYEWSIQNQQPYVIINQNAINDLAIEILQEKPYEWNEENWHYNIVLLNDNNNTNNIDGDYLQQDIIIKNWSYDVRFERTAAYILALDAINFCFWTDDNNNNDNHRFEYEHLAISMKNMAQADHTIQNENMGNTISKSYIFTAENMSSMTLNKMKELFEQYAVHDNEDDSTVLIPPDIEQRVRMWNHIGHVLQTKFHSSVSYMIQQANGSGPALVELLVENFPNCFGGDCNEVELQTTTTTQKTNNTDDDDNNKNSNLNHIEISKKKKMIYFYKRAQICVGDINAALQLNLNNMDEITTFADYRVPQILRYKNILQYSNELSLIIDTYTQIPVGCPMEISIRAATVTAVEWLVNELNNIQQQQKQDEENESSTTASSSPTKSTKVWTALITDWYLWNVGEKMMNEGKLKPHHRVKTIYY